MMKINLVTLGCSKNIVDSEKLAFAVDGYEFVFDQNNYEAKIVIVNTCGFIQDAKEESIDTILDFVNAKKKGLIDKVFVMGCLSQRYKDELQVEMPEVDYFFGVNDLDEILKVLQSERKKGLDRQFINKQKHYAYLKIAEGCDRSCSFCAIPIIRGQHKSVPMDVLIQEAELLAKKGVKELILVAQDLTYYGLDLYKKASLSDLLKKLVNISGIEWIRLQYSYPVFFSDALIETIKNQPKICNYIDIPFQHISSHMLRRMRRGYDKNDALLILNKLRKEIPKVMIRTTLLVGHPGETAADYAELLQLVKEFEFDRLGVFTYSHEEGTYSYINYEDSIPDEVKLERMEELMSVQEEISFRNNQKFIGETMTVIIDRVEPDYIIGRTEYDSPEVDNEVLIKNNQDVQPREFRQVRILEATEFDLFGEIVK
ncbi:MAG: 30S ribosomal protein S12 methylthiotransferase RimO [Marinilabiliales bacterium]|nr:MAG: 30S ribosomal protein S12 methylthiotransferase RimO [Marinilabiliales bacterium]